MKHRHIGALAWWLGVVACSVPRSDTKITTRPAPAVASSAPVHRADVEPSAPRAAEGGVGPAPSSEPLDRLLATLPPPSESTSIGSPTNGRVRGAVALPHVGPGFRYNDRRSQNARFGTAEVIRAIVRAAAAVERDLPGSELVVNDIGLEHGGAIAHHGSHRAGRDADLLFFLLGADQKPIASVGAPLDPEGNGHDYKELSIADDDVPVHFDAPRTWRLVRALLEDPEAEVQRIFVVEHLRTRLLREAERSPAPAEVVARFADVSCQPGYPHDDHLHVRWFCSVEDLQHGCEDAVPLYPWRAQTLRDAGVVPVLAKRARSRDPAPLTTLEDAERAVKRQRPHPDVLSFLERRKSWERQPHPGRPYCR